MQQVFGDTEELIVRQDACWRPEATPRAEGPLRHGRAHRTAGWRLAERPPCVAPSASKDPQLSDLRDPKKVSSPPSILVRAPFLQLPLNSNATDFHYHDSTDLYRVRRQEGRDLHIWPAGPGQADGPHVSPP